MRRRVCTMTASLLWLLVLFSLGGGAAQAAPAPGKAQERMHSGMAHRRAGELDQAIADFTEAYRLSPEPNYLYLLGEAQKEAGRTQEAIAAYRRYLEVAPAAPDRRLVQDEIDTLSQQAQVPAAAVRIPAGAARREDVLPLHPTRLVAVAAPRERPAAAPGRLVWLWASLGVAVAAGAAVGLVLGLRPTEPTFVTGPGALP